MSAIYRQFMSANEYTTRDDTFHFLFNHSSFLIVRPIFILKDTRNDRRISSPFRSLSLSLSVALCEIVHVDVAISPFNFGIRL